MSLVCNTSLCCRAVLQKFYIGNLARQAGEVAAVTYQQPPEEQQFYTVLRQRVERYFRKNEVCNIKFFEGSLSTQQYGESVLAADNVAPGTQISHRASVEMYIKTALILSGLAASCYGTFFCFSTFWVSADQLSSAQTHMANFLL